MKDQKVINVGNTQAKVIMTHARRSLLYFIRNFTDVNLLQQQEETLRNLSKRRRNDKT